MVCGVSTFSLRFEDISWAQQELRPLLLQPTPNSFQIRSKRILVCKSVEEKKKLIATVLKPFDEVPTSYIRESNPRSSRLSW